MESEFLVCIRSGMEGTVEHPRVRDGNEDGLTDRGVDRSRAYHIGLRDALADGPRAECQGLVGLD